LHPPAQVGQDRPFSLGRRALFPWACLCRHFD